MRFRDNFNFTLTVSPDVDLEMMRIPAMIIQPYVENAVKHGLLHKEGDRQLDISLCMDGTDLVVKIDDNGIGRRRSEELNRISSRKHKPFSVTANQKRIDLLNQERGGNKVGLQFIDKQDIAGQPTGTTVIIRIPIGAVIEH